MNRADLVMYSPVIVAVVEFVVFVGVKISGRAKSSGLWLLTASFVYALLGAVLSLVALVVWMEWYQRTTGYGAGNAPLFWIFGYGPMSVAFGQVLALTHWWFKKQSNQSLKSGTVVPPL